MVGGRGKSTLPARRFPADSELPTTTILAAAFDLNPRQSRPLIWPTNCCVYSRAVMSSQLAKSLVSVTSLSDPIFPDHEAACRVHAWPRYKRDQLSGGWSACVVSVRRDDMSLLIVIKV